MNYKVSVSLPLVRDSSKVSMTSSSEVASSCKDISNLAQESFHVLTLNTKNKLIARHMISLGIVDATYVHPREVFRPSIVDGAKAIILLHNHPSGDTTPSADDIQITRRLIEAGRIVDINVLDHIIFSSDEGKFHSMRDMGDLQFIS